MDRNITITARDGKKFNGTNYEELLSRIDAYEVEYEARRKSTEEAIEKVKLERIEKEKIRSEDMAKIIKQVDLLNNLVNTYCEKYNVSIFYTNKNGKLEVNTDLWGFRNIFELFR